MIVFAWVLSLFSFPVFRYSTKIFLNKINLWKKKVIIVESGSNSFSLVEAIRKNKTLGYEIVGALSTEKSKIGSSFAGVEVLGHIDEIVKWKERLEFEDIIASLPDMSRDKVIELLKKCEGVSETIRYIPRTGELIATGVEIDNIGKIFSLTIRKNLTKPWNILIKNISEYFIAFFIGVLLLPFFLIVGIAVKIDSRGPVFFIQERYGKKGRKIKLIKFRSMYTDSYERMERFFKENQDAKKEWQKYRKLRGFDPRITSVGKFLRKLSLDELPQLINVVFGEMSLVGPRPYLVEELKEVESKKSFLLQVKPGITGLWQTSGRSLVSFKDRLDLDEYYLRNWSLWFDIVIMIRTIKTTFSGKGAY